MKKNITGALIASIIVHVFFAGFTSKQKPKDDDTFLSYSCCGKKG